MLNSSLNIIGNGNDLDNKCYIKIYHKLNNNNNLPFITTELYIETIELTINGNQSIELFVDSIKKIISFTISQIYIYFDEEIINTNKPSPYRLLNGILLWSNPPKITGQIDLSDIGYLSKTNNLSKSIPNEVRIEHLLKKKIFNFIAIIIKK